MSLKRFLVILIILGGVIYLLSKIIIGFKELDNSFEEVLPTKYAMSPEDSSLFAKEYRSKIKVVKVLHHKMRNSINFLQINDLNLILFKIDSDTIMPWDSFVQWTKGNPDRATGHIYTTEQNDFFKISFSAGKLEKAEKILITFSGSDQEVMFTSDSLIGYSLAVKKLAVKYAYDDPEKIYIETNQNILSTKSLPVHFVFKRRGKSICFLMVTSSAEKNSVPQNLSSKLLD